MASNELIDEVISPKASQQVVQLTSDLEKLSAQFEATFKNAKALTDALEGAKNIPDTSRGTDDTRKSLNELEKIKVKLLQTEEKLAVASSEANKSLIEQKDALQQVNREIKEKLKFEQAEEGSINQMRSNLKQLQSQYDALGKSTRDAFGAPLLKQIQAVDTELKKLEGGSGRFQRNVGNYSNATFQLSQSLRELPAFAFSAQTGILALSNNLPMLIDSFNQVKASAGSAGKALAVFGRSIFTFTNLFTIALGLFTVFYKEIMEYVGVTKKAVDATNNLQKAFDSSIESGYKEVATLEHLYAKTQDVTLSLEERMKAVNELQRIYPAYFNNLKDEEILAGKARDMYLELNDALMDTIISRAYSAQVEEIGKGIVKYGMMIEELSKETSKLTGKQGNKNEFIYTPSNQEVDRLEKYIHSISLIPGIGEELSKLIKGSGESSVGGAARKVLKELTNARAEAEMEVKKILNFVDVLYGSKINGVGEKAKKSPKAKKEAEVNRIEELKNQYENERKVAQTHYEKGEYDYLLYQHNLIMIDEKYSKIKIDARTQKEKDSLIELNLALAKNTRESFIGLGQLAAERWKAGFDEYNKGKKSEINDNLMKNAKENIDNFQKYLNSLPPVEVSVDLKFKLTEKELKEALETIQQIANSTLSTLSDISSMLAARENARMDEKERRMNEYYDSEVKAIERSGKKGAEKDKELMKLAAQKEAQQKKIDGERATAQKKQAIRQRAIDLLGIISNTALAITRALSDSTVSNPYLRIANAVVVGALGTAQSIAVAGQPIPEFAKGTESSPEGYAIVGEKGTELVTEPSGKSWLTPAKDTITYLKKGSKVTTNEKLMEMVKNSAYVQLANLNTPVTSDLYTKTLIEKFEENTNELKALKGIMQDKAMSVQIQGNYDHYLHVRKNIR